MEYTLDRPVVTQSTSPNRFNSRSALSTVRRLQLRRLPMVTILTRKASFEPIMLFSSFSTARIVLTDVCAWRDGLGNRNSRINRSRVHCV